MVGGTISNLKSMIFVLSMKRLSLYLHFYAKINFNILYTYMLNMFMLQLCTPRKIKLNH